jgi:hypothetical protein
MMTASPLGRYGEIAAAIISVGIIGAAILVHLIPPTLLGLTTPPETSWLDNAALIALGVVLGQRSTTNGAAKIAAAAHARLDAINAPPADTSGGPVT